MMLHPTRLATVAVLAGVAWALPAPAQTPVKVRIQSLESSGQSVVAQFNPTELSVTKSVPWKTHRKSESDAPTLEFTTAEPKTMTFELLFDEFASGLNVHDTTIVRLEQFTRVDPTTKRPPLCVFTWGSEFPAFAGVVETMSVKYTLFLPDGTPVRASVGLTLREADHVRVRGGTEGTVVRCQTNGDCPAGQTCQSGVCAPPP